MSKKLSQLSDAPPQLKTDTAEHLSKISRIQLGGYYTPKNLVARVYEFVRPYRNSKKNVVIFDSAGGCGAFLGDLAHTDYRVADCDSRAADFLKANFDPEKIFKTNSLSGVRRGKFSISQDAFLIMVGNPPYNDTTSEFKSGEKGIHVCDEDIKDKDLGISFLRSYDKLKADIVCVLHPLSYLIKESNFKRLKGFRENYKLVRAEIFSSALFSGTGAGKFPIVIALYERTPSGMTFEHIKRFQFDVFESDKKFILGDFETTDGYIHKYPPRTNDPKKSPLGLYYYTFRDFNSLKKNTSFFTEERPNGILVTLENFYKYAYLYALKTLFNPQDAWLYGNLSPLVDSRAVEKHQKDFVLYAVTTNKVFKEIAPAVSKKILEFYGISDSARVDVDKLENLVQTHLKKLLR